ncbi:MAG: UDP-N-acetylmuramate dehydrogenase [Pseudomonadota bacterium]
MARPPLVGLADLPSVRGKYVEGAVLADLTWLRVGGPADVLFMPADAEDLSQFLAATPPDIPVTVLGVGSNTLVRDGGVRGVVVRLGAPFAEISVDGTIVHAGAAALDASVAKRAARASVAGLEFLRGVPGTIGGALRMNAGAYGGEVKDVLVSCAGYDRAGRRVEFTNVEMGFDYRRSAVPDGIIFTEATFEGAPGDAAEITARMEEIMAKREASQPIREKTSGSTFKNPDPDASGGRSAWAMVDAVGGRGRRIGDAQFSEQHANFLINRGSATAADLEALVEGVRADILREEGVEMHWEVKRIGEPL